MLGRWIHYFRGVRRMLMGGGLDKIVIVYILDVFRQRRIIGL